MNVTATTDNQRRTQAERTALSDARMLETAVRLIVEHGAERTTLKEVGEGAGYSRGLASYRFGSKAGLFSFIVRAVGEEWLREMQRAVRDEVGLDAIIAATDAHYRFIEESRDRIRAFYILWFDSIGPDPELKAVIAKIHERRRQDIEAWIERGVAAGMIRSDADVRAVAGQFCATIIGIVYQWLVTPGAHEKIRDLHDGLKQQMFSALATPTAGTRAAPREEAPA